jgi:dihydroorotate dehydrogenase (NAD+) catalytic subunit
MGCGSVADLRTRLCGIELEHPLINASGTLDALLAGTLGLSAYVTKTVTLEPREGNRPPRIAETPAGMVNSIGLANPGLDRFCNHALPQLAELGVPLIVSVGGWSREQYAVAVRRLAEQPAVRAIELNVSCPNVDTGCISIGADAAETRELLRRCRQEADLPLLAKLSPTVADIAAIGVAAAEGGADGLAVINTVRGIAIDRTTLRPLLGGGGGGLSGPAVKPVALHAVYTCFRATGLPVIGMGGVETAADCLELLAAGATAVAIGTTLFRDPGAPARIVPELSGLLAAHGFAGLVDAVGRAHNMETEAQVKLER